MPDFTQKPPFTKDDWPARFADEMAYDSTLLNGYLFALELFIPALTSIAEIKDEKAKSAALLAFIKAQRDFLGDINEKWYGDNPGKYGLPEFYGPG